MATINENKFYQALESIFTGANIEGDSGYVNLLKIKSSYYKLILEEFKKSVNNEQIITDSFKEEFFDKLYSFFEKYFSESGSVYFVKTANWQRVYEQVYTDNKDVVLFWKTHMLYYVKSDILFQSIDVNIVDDESKQEYNFYFDVGNLQAKQNNEKKALIFTFREVKENKTSEEVLNNKQGKKTFVFDVSYSEKGTKTKTDDIIKATKIPEAIIEKAFATFKKQSEVDFFINKNAEKFLTEQLDMYLHQILLNEENKFEQKRLDQLKTIKIFALKIIKFIAQFEDELVRVWNKPKFALNSNYVITIDKLSDEIIGKIAKHENLQEQIKEWQELGMVDESFDFAKRSEKEKFLPIDTKHFKDLEIDILSLFDNIDEALDGRLIHSENYQALNTLQEKYKEKVQCIYIDPPFNTGSDFAYIDKFQDSTWLSLINDRIEIARKFLRDDGSFYLHLDDNANDYGKQIIKSLFSEIVEVIFDTNATKDEEADLFGYKSFGRNFILKHQTIFFCRNEKYKFNKLWKPNRNTTNLSIGWLDLIAEQKKEVDKPQKIEDFNYFIEYWEDSKLIKKKIEVNEKLFPVGDIWNDIFSFTQSEMRVSESFAFSSSQKPENLLRRVFQSTTDKSDYILDFFGGLGTSFAVAHKLNRKYLGIELGDHFNEFYFDNNEKKMGVLGRMKWVLFGDRKMKAIDKDRRPHLSKDINWQGGGFFKYYSLEQYEDTLRNMKYKDSSPNSIFDTRKAFEQYIFYADQKFAHVLEIGKDKLDIDFDKLYPNIDFAETISNLLGLPIKKITKTSVILQDEDSEREIKTDYKNMTELEKLAFVRLLKPALWWGE